MDAASFERELLKLVFETNVVLERGQVAYHLGLTLDEAERQLDALATRGVLTLDSDDAGNLYYLYPNRPPPRRQLPAARDDSGLPPEFVARVANAADIASRAAAAAHIAVTAMVNAEHHASAHQRAVPFHDGLEPITTPVVALASVLPGGGHMARRRVIRGLAWMGAVVTGYVVFWPVGIAVHIASGIDATINFGKR